MANGFSKSDVVFFEDVLEGFEPNLSVSQHAEKFSPGMQEFVQSGLQIWRPMPYSSLEVTGLNITGMYADATQLSVPSSLNTSTDVINVPREMSAVELNDPLRRKGLVESAVLTLAGHAERKVADVAANQGSLVITKSTALTGYDDVTPCEAIMSENDIAQNKPKTMAFNIRDYNRMSGELAGKNTMQGRPDTAYGRSLIGDNVAGFSAFKAQYAKTLAAAGGGAITVSGAQSHIPVATDANGNNVDNRYGNLTVSATAGVAAGDAFTIAGVNAVSHLHKQDTGQLKTFRVVEVVDGTTLKITPQIIVNHGGATQPEKEYANCSAQAANLAAITWLNTTQAKTNIFFANNSIELIGGSLAVDGDEFANMAVMREKTSNGIEIVFAKQGDISTLKAKYRLTMWLNANLLNPEMAGILLGGQA